MRTGIELIADERERQVTVEGWTPEGDATYTKGELPRAAIAYARYNTPVDNIPDSEDIWPWLEGWWKPSGQIRNLTKAGALIAAEIDRIQRSSKRIDP